MSIFQKEKRMEEGQSGLGYDKRCFVVQLSKWWTFYAGFWSVFYAGIKGGKVTTFLPLVWIGKFIEEPRMAIALKQRIVNVKFSDLSNQEIPVKFKLNFLQNCPPILPHPAPKQPNVQLTKYTKNLNWIKEHINSPISKFFISKNFSRNGTRNKQKRNKKAKIIA